MVRITGTYVVLAIVTMVTVNVGERSIQSYGRIEPLRIIVVHLQIYQNWVGLQWPLCLPEAWYNKGCIHRLVNPRKVCASIVISMSVYLCLYLSQNISGTTRLISTKFLWKLPAMDRSSSSRVTKSQGKGQCWGNICPTSLIL